MTVNKKQSLMTVSVYYIFYVAFVLSFYIGKLSVQLMLPCCPADLLICVAMIYYNYLENYK